MSRRIGALTSLKFESRVSDNDFSWKEGGRLFRPSIRSVLHVSNVLGDIDKDSMFMRLDWDGGMLFEHKRDGILNSWRLPPDHYMEFDVVRNDEVVTRMIWNP